MDYSFLSFTLDIWLILHIIISLFCKPPSKHFPVWKSIQVLHICNKKKKKKKILPIIGQHRQEDEEKHLSGFNGKWNFNKRDLTVPFFVPVDWCLWSIYDCTVRPSRSDSRSYGWQGGWLLKSNCIEKLPSEAPQRARRCASRNPGVQGEAGGWRRGSFPKSWHSPVSPLLMSVANAA